MQLKRTTRAWTTAQQVDIRHKEPRKAYGKEKRIFKAEGRLAPRPLHLQQPFVLMKTVKNARYQLRVSYATVAATATAFDGIASASRQSSGIWNEHVRNITWCFCSGVCRDF